ncbi:hypothetical protein B9D02_22275 (plasmid) [Pantoea vagans]|nr:hypothetical protein B9D02_22275 [Pantoea vagans]
MIGESDNNSAFSLFLATSAASKAAAIAKKTPIITWNDIIFLLIIQTERTPLNITSRDVKIEFKCIFFLEKPHLLLLPTKALLRPPTM